MSQIPYLKYDELVALAQTFLQKHHPSLNLPIPIEAIVELRLRMDIVPAPGLQNRFGVDAFITRDLKAIWVDEDVYKNRRRETRLYFSLAHEVSHLILEHHNWLPQEFSPDSVIDSYAQLSSDAYARIEWQASALAALLLVPRTGLAQRFHSIRKLIASTDLSDLEIDEIVERLMAEEYAVNWLTMHLRLEKDGLLHRP